MGCVYVLHASREEVYRKFREPMRVVESIDMDDCRRVQHATVAGQTPACRQKRDQIDKAVE